MHRILIMLAGAGALVWVGASGLAERAPSDDPDALLCEHPCPGWRYEVVYSPTEGVIYGVGGYDPTDPFQPSDPDRGYVVRKGERVLEIEVLDITGHPNLVDIMRNLSAAYYVDLERREVRRKPHAALPVPSEGEGDLAGLWVSLPVIAALGSASAFVLRRSRRTSRNRRLDGGGGSYRGWRPPPGRRWQGWPLIDRNG